LVRARVCRRLFGGNSEVDVESEPLSWRATAFVTNGCRDRAIASTTSRIRGFGGLSATAGLEEQPRRRQAIAWLRLSGGSSPGGPGEAAALVLAIQEFVAITAGVK